MKQFKVRVNNYTFSKLNGAKTTYGIDHILYFQHVDTININSKVKEMIFDVAEDHINSFRKYMKVRGLENRIKEVQ